MKRCVDEKRRVTSELVFSLGTRAVRTVQIVSDPLRDESGVTTAYRTILVDISELKELENKLRLLSEAGKSLAASLDYTATLNATARLAVPALADLCMVDLNADVPGDLNADVQDESGKIERVAVVFADTGKQQMLAERMKEFAPRPGWQTPQSQVIASGEPVLLSEISDLGRARTAYDDRHVDALQAAGIRSLMVVPLSAHGRTLGALTLASAESGRRYSSLDLQLAQDFASRAALAVDNARLYAERGQIEKEQRFLAEVGLILANTLDYDETVSRIVALSLRDLADCCIVDVVGNDGQLRKLTAVSRDAAKATVLDSFKEIPLERGRPRLTSSALETKRAVLMKHLTPEGVASLAQNEEHLRLLRAIDPRSVIAVPLLSHGNLLGAMAFVSTTPSRVYGPADVRLAEALAQRAALAIENAELYRKASQAIRARDDVLGVVVHDLRNPLGTILMLASHLGRRPPELDPLARNTADAIERAAARMNRLIQDLLDVTSMEAGHLRLARSRVNAAQLVSDSVESQKALAAAASLELRLDLPENLGDKDAGEVWADRDRLLQVFENLISNAVKFTDPGGPIVVSATPQNDAILFSVTDSGAGIAAEDLPRVFDRFWQAQRPGHHGAGLGLPIVKGIVESHGGHVHVDSTPGRGSTFSFTIPTTSAEGAGGSE
jgi:signal transduction histidine kinase